MKQEAKPWLTTIKKISQTILEREEIQDDGRIIRVPVYSRQKELLFTRWRDIAGKNVFVQPGGCPLYLWGVDSLNGRGPVYLTEGETDRLTLLELGYSNVVAIPGAGNFKEQWAEEFRGLSPIYLILDNDDAGKKGTQKIASILAAQTGATIRIVALPAHVKDISELWLTYYPEKEAAKEKVDVLLTQAEEWVSLEEEPIPAGIQETEHLTDMGNAVRLVRQHGRVLRYCHPWARWLIWDGQQWQKDDTDVVRRKAKDTVREIYREAAAAHDADSRKALARWAMQSESESRIEAMISLARSEPGIPILPDQLDMNPWLLNCENGTLDLHTGELRPHNREDLLTKMAPVEYDPQATCPTWHAFLDRIMDHNQSLIAFLRRAIGYSLTGDISEQTLFFLYGRGANGKTTFLRAIQDTLGNYAKQGDPNLLILRRGEVHPTGLADLRSSRFVASTEVEEGRRMAEVLVKQLTGGDKIKARFMRQDFFEFESTYKIWLAANHKPIVTGTDEAIWRRIRLIPFQVMIPEAEQDKQLSSKLRAEGSGILRWAVEGCLAWQREGLGVPEEVREATKDYRDEMDILAGFIAECCMIEPLAKASAKDLYKTYVSWCEENGERSITQRAFGARLKERGFDNHKGTGGRYWWTGIGLVE